MPQINMCNTPKHIVNSVLKKTNYCHQTFHLFYNTNSFSKSSLHTDEKKTMWAYLLKSDFIDCVL